MTTTIITNGVSIFSFLLTGTYVTMVLADVDEHALDDFSQTSPLVVSTLMAHENKMSVMHFLVQKSQTTCEDTVQVRGGRMRLLHMR